jgi:KDO2-lipid IV(A) lauroyltransferase
MIAYKLDPKHRERADANLKLAFPDWSDAKRHETVKEVFRHFGRMAGDFARTPLRTRQELLDSAELDGIENIEAAVSQGKGVLAVTCHLGNWERFGHIAVASGYPLSVVARDANQSGVQERLQQLREFNGMKVIARGRAMREILQSLKNKEVVALLPDQNSGECYVPFFGKPAGTVMGPAILHLRTGAPLLPAYCLRTGTGSYRMTVKPPIDTSDCDGDPAAITAKVNLAIENAVREAPEQYLWMHDRWKEARLNGLL